MMGIVGLMLSAVHREGVEMISCMNGPTTMMLTVSRAPRHGIILGRSVSVFTGIIRTLVGRAMPTNTVL